MVVRRMEERNRRRYLCSRMDDTELFTLAEKTLQSLERMMNDCSLFPSEMRHTRV